MFPGVTVVGQVVALRMETVLVSGPDDSIGDAFPLVRVGAAPHVVARLGHVARVGDAVFTGSDAVGGLVSENIVSVFSRSSSTHVTRVVIHSIFF